MNYTEPNVALINVAFNISDPVRSTIIKVSKEIRDDYNSDWWVDDERYHLHLPVYLFPCDPGDLELVKAAALEYSKNLTSIEVEIADLFDNGAGLIMLAFSMPKELYSYHLKALELFNPIRGERQRGRNNNLEYLRTIPPEDREKIEKYGHLWVLDKYKPHVTIARIKDTKASAEVIGKYKELLIGKQTMLERVQVHQPLVEEVDKTVILFDAKLPEN